MVKIREYNIKGIPRPQPRPRASATGVFYSPNPPHIKKWKEAVRDVVSDDTYSIEGPVYLQLNFRMPRPVRLLRKADPNREIPHTARPDIDNLVKLVMDVMTKEGVWDDDSQVCNILCSKYYHTKDGSPGVDIILFDPTLSQPQQQETK